MGQVVVADSSVLIALGEIGKLDLLRVVLGPVQVPGAVFEETVEARPEASSALAVRDAIDAGWIQVRSAEPTAVARMRRRAPNLAQGELEALSMCVDTPLSLLLADERSARRVAMVLGVAHTGTLGVILRGHRAGQLTRPEALATVDRVVRAGLWVAPELVAELRDALARGQ